MGSAALAVVPADAARVPSQGEVCLPAVLGPRPVFVGGCIGARYRVENVGPRLVLAAPHLPPVPVDLVAALVSGGRQARAAARELERAGGLLELSGQWLVVKYRGARIAVAPGKRGVFMVEGGPASGSARVEGQWPPPGNRYRRGWEPPRRALGAL